MSDDLLPRALRLDRQHIVRRDEPGVEVGPNVRELRVHALHRLLEHARRLAGGHERPERTGDLELQVGPGRRQVLAAELDLGPRRALERLQPPARVDRPLQLDASCGSCRARRDRARGSLRPA